MTINTMNSKEFHRQVGCVKEKTSKYTIDEKSAPWKDKVEKLGADIEKSRDENKVQDGKQYHPLPGNHMDFSGSVAEEVDKNGNLVQYRHTDEHGRSIIIPRRGMSEKALEQLARISLDFHRAMIANGEVADRVLEFDKSKYTMEKVLEECHKRYNIEKVVENDEGTNIVIQLQDGTKACLGLLLK